MAVANQIYAFINATATEALGASAITVKDTSTLVSLGETVLSSANNTDAFYQKLVDRIGATYVKYRVYKADNKNSILKRPLDFGIILQKVQTAHIAQAKSNGSWGNQVNPYAKEKDTTDIESKLFSVLATWEVDTKVIYDYQLRTAFTNEAAMGAFVNLIYNDMYNALEFEIEQTIKLAKATLFAAVLNVGKGTQCRNLLDEYNTLTNAGLTVALALTTPAFLKYASTEIKKALSRVQKMSRLFNAEAADRFTTRDRLKINVLTDYAAATQSYLEADTYNKDLVALPGYEEVDSWQASGEDYSFDNVSFINIQNSEISEEAVEQGGIIAAIYDEDAVGLMIQRIRTKTAYNPASECTNVFHKADYGYFVDPSEVCVIFYIANA